MSIYLAKQKGHNKMLDKNPIVLATAYRRVVAKTNRIKELGLNTDLTEEQINEIIEARARAKAETEGGEWTTYVKGQRWYIEDLIKFSELGALDALEYEYMQSFPDAATEFEMLQSLEALIGK